MTTPKHISNSELKEHLLGAYKRLESKKRTEVWSNALLLALCWILSLIFIEYIFYLAPAAKIGAIASLIVISIVTIIWGNRTLRKIPFIEFYRSFSQQAGIPELSYALDLEKNTQANPRLVEAAIFKNLELIDPGLLQSKLVDFLSTNPINKRLRKKQTLLVALILITGITGYRFSSAGVRLAQFWVAFEQPNPYTYTVLPGSTTVEQGSEFSVQVQFTGEQPNEVSLYIKTPVEVEFRKRGMDGSSNVYTSTPIHLNTNLSYFIDMDGFRSEVYEVEVQLRPRLSTLQAVVIAPQYTQVDTTWYNYPFSQIEGPQGSQVIISGTVNKPVQKFLIQSRKYEEALSINDTLSFEYKYLISKPDTLSFRLTDANNLENQNPFRFTIAPVLDRYPFVEIIEPESSFESVEPKIIDILYRANDDFGLTKAELRYELQKAFVNRPITGKFSLNPPVSGNLETFSWSIEELNLSPKDVLSFWIEVTDNDAYNGEKTSASNKITLTVPSLIDYFEDLGEREDEVVDDLEDISQSFEEMQEQYELFKEQLREDPQINFEQQRQLLEVQKQQQEIEKQIEELNKKFEEIKEELSENNLLSEETLEAYNELQQLMEEIDDPAFKEALEKLRQQMQSLSPEQLRQALEETEFNEELYKQRLERTLELFKQLKLNSDLEKLANSYEELAREEEKTAFEETNTQEHTELEKEAEQRRQRLQDLEQLQKQLDQLSENTTPKNEKAVAELQQTSEQELEEIRKKVQEMLNELEKAMNQSPSESQPPMPQQEYQQKKQDIAESLKKLSELTRKSIQTMQQQQMSINIAALRYILHSLLTLSVEQEDLVTYASATESRSQAYIEFAREQRTLETIFKSLSDSLFEISKENPQFSNLINEKKLEVEKQLTNSLEQMAERNQSQASIATRQAMGGINELAFLIANLLDQLQNQSNGGGGGGDMSLQQMMERMQQMGQDQQQLNQQIQDIINDIQGERLTQDQMERLNQLSRQQNEIRKQLQELQRNGGLEGGDQLSSQLERMIEEMEETINDLRGGATDPTLIERQQNILSRMLEAEKAMQERDEEEKREGTTGTDIPRPQPPEMTLEELEKEIRNRLNDPNFTKYSPDYQRLIERYFELLKQIENRDIQ